MEHYSSELSGFEHMVAEHNSLFSAAESTGDIGAELMMEGTIPAIPGSSSASVGTGVGYVTLPFDLSTDSSAGGKLNDGSSSVTLSESITDYPEAATGFTAVAAVGSSIANSSTPDLPDAILIFFKNDRPNSYVEKSAADVYNALHRECNKAYTFPAVIAESPSGYETAAKIFKEGSFEKAKETLDIWESILEDYA